ncbi:MAG TPA: hypothetical protein VGN35_10145 [Jatrophihabitantaceae bacterium]|nr:hypothetical protein [Jatrophihabitantaceae bacterium]
MAAGHSGTPLAAKLGIKDGSRVLLVRAPAGFDLGALPSGVNVRSHPAGAQFDVVLLFCPDRATLVGHFAHLIPALETAGALWACWPKQASGVATDLTENGVREHGLETGLVDVKIAAVDHVWSGLKFVRRLADR